MERYLFVIFHPPPFFSYYTSVWIMDKFIERYLSTSSVCLGSENKKQGKNKEKNSALEQVKSNPIIGLNRPIGFQEAEAPRFQDNRHMKVVRLSALHTGCLYPPGNIPGTHFCQRQSQTQGHSAAGRIFYS
jgi:hypothetical protein